MRVHFDETAETVKNNTHNDVKTNEKSPTMSGVHAFTTVLTILEYCMTMFGIYHKPLSRRYTSSDIRMSFWKNNVKIASKMLLCYNVLILMALWANVVRIIGSFFIGDSTRAVVVLRTIGGIWYSMCALNATMMVKSSHQRTIQKINDHLTKHVFRKINELDIDKNANKLMRKVVIWLVLGGMVILLNCVTGTVITYFPNVSEDNMHLTFNLPLPETSVVRILVVILHILNSVAWILPPLFIMTLTTVFNHSFQVCKSALEKLVINSKWNEFSTDLHQIRRLHLDICKGVEVMDKDFSVLFANWYLTNISIACFVLFHIIKTESSIFLIGMYMFWAIAAIAGTVLTSGVAASLNQAAHSPLEHIYYMRTTAFTMDQMGQLQLFLSKLTGNSIGFTVLNLIVITKEMLLTLVGLFLTYFFILIQF